MSQPSLEISTMGGTVKTYSWQWQAQTLTITYEVLGQGPPVVILPAFSTVSTRLEMSGLATRLAAQYQTITLDWPGFGTSSRIPLDYEPELYFQFLHAFLQDHFSAPVHGVAAGHAAGYVVQLAAQYPTLWSKIALVAPTWRGPLAIMGVPKPIRSSLYQMVCSSTIGPLLYKLNTAPAFLRFMYKRHVYIDDSLLTPEFMAQRHQITQQSGGRYAPAGFVTGLLDPASTREEILTAMQTLSVPLMIILADQAPPASKAEMEAMAALPNVQAVHHSPGSLGLYEEFAPEVADSLLPFLAQV